MGGGALLLSETSLVPHRGKILRLVMPLRSELWAHQVWKVTYGFGRQREVWAQRGLMRDALQKDSGVRIAQAD